MLSRLFFMWGALAYSFDKRLSPLFIILGFCLLRTVNAVGMTLDHAFFPQVRRVKIRSPIVIVGNPRSGTTFLQRFLVDHGFGAGGRLWKMLFPSLTIQALIRPFLPHLEKISPARHHLAVAHKTSLTAVETEDPALFFRFFDGFFAYGFFLALAKEDLRPLFDPRTRDTSRRDFAFLERLWLRNLVGEKQPRVVSKLFSLGVRLPQFLEVFPDAKILYLVRDPLSTVPSGMSLVTGVLDRHFGFWRLAREKRQRYLDRLYRGLLDLSLRFHEDYVGGKIPEDRVMVIPYDRLMGDFVRLMDEIMAFVDVSPTPALREAIEAAAEKQREFSSAHAYDLQQFGLANERICADFEPIYQTFLAAAGAEDRG